MCTSLSFSDPPGYALFIFVSTRAKHNAWDIAGTLKGFCCINEWNDLQLPPESLIVESICLDSSGSLGARCLPLTTGHRNIATHNLPGWMHLKASGNLVTVHFIMWLQLELNRKKWMASSEHCARNRTEGQCSHKIKVTVVSSGSALELKLGWVLHYTSATAPCHWMERPWAFISMEECSIALIS